MSSFVGFQEADLQRVRRCEKTWWFAVDYSEMFWVFFWGGGGLFDWLTVNLVVVYSLKV